MILSNAIFFLDQCHAMSDMRGNAVIAGLFERTASLLQKRINSQGVHFDLHLDWSGQGRPVPFVYTRTHHTETGNTCEVTNAVRRVSFPIISQARINAIRGFSTYDRR